jgi:ribose/xylose/arabinose/galactoside ABC-type transport system permease subunit
VLWLSLAYFVALVPFLPTLATSANIANLLSNAWPLLVVALGQTFVMTIGGIDLSQGAVIGPDLHAGRGADRHGGPPEVLSKAPIWGS